MKYKIASTDQFLGLCQEAILSDRNRKVNIANLSQIIDPDGTHVCWYDAIHNDGAELRTAWYVKVCGTDKPVTCWLDITFQNFKKLRDHEVEDAK